MDREAAEGDQAGDPTPNPTQGNRGQDRPALEATVSLLRTRVRGQGLVPTATPGRGVPCHSTAAMSPFGKEKEKRGSKRGG